MINRLIEFSVKNRWIVLAFTALLAIFGFVSFKNLPIDAVPDITNVQVQINTPVAGLAPEQVERVVTYPIEAAMNGLERVTEVRSLTRFGLSQVTVVFEDDSDIYRARQLIAERLQTLADEFPPGTSPKMGPITTGLGEIYHYGVEAEKIAKGQERMIQLMELRSIQEWYVKPRLLTVKGVAEVNTIGGFEKQFHIQPDIEKLAYYGLHFDDLEEALERSNQNVGGGYVKQTAEQFIVQATGLLDSIEDIRAVPIKALENLKAVTVGDVADVRLDTELRVGGALVEGEEAVVGTAMMLMGENSRTVSTRVKERLQEIQKGLPAGVKIETLYDRSDLVNATLSTVEHNLFTGAALVILVLFFLIGNVRAALITAIIIPLTLLFTFLLMKWRGISGSLMSLGALDFGIIIDGTVIVLDNCVRFIRERAQKMGRDLTKAEIREAVTEATIEIRKAAGFGELVIVVVFLPIFALVGIEGKMFEPMAITFIFAVLGAVLFSFTTAPALASIFLSGKPAPHDPWIMKKFAKGYAPVLPFAFKRRRLVIGSALGLVLASGILFSRLGGEFLPQLNEGSFLFHCIRPNSISIDQASRLQSLTEKAISEFPEVQIVFSRFGTAEIASDPMPINISDTYIMLHDRGDWPKIDGKRRTREELLDAIIAKLRSEIPGQRLIALQPIEMRFNELLEGTRADVSAKVFGEDMDELMRITQELGEIVRSVPGAGDVELEVKGKAPYLKIEPNKEFLRSLGISSFEVMDAISTGLAGKEVGFVFENTRKFPIIIRLKEEVRSDLEALTLLPVGISPGLTVPLHQIATLEFAEGYNSITRENSQRRAAVLINPKGRDTQSFVHEAQEKTAARLKLPPGYFVEWGGNFKNLEKASERLLVLTPAVLFLVLLMIYFAFRNVGQTLLIFSCVPLALVGGVIALSVSGMPFSISSGVGFIALTGISIMNGVVLLSYFNQLREEGLAGEALVQKGTSVRLRPILMTALVEIFGFLPMMVATGIGSEVQKPLATVVIGGIVSSTLLTLVLLPVLYVRFERFFVRKQGLGS